jgi:hypothetical protein
MSVVPEKRPFDATNSIWAWTGSSYTYLRTMRYGASMGNTIASHGIIASEVTLARLSDFGFGNRHRGSAVATLRKWTTLPHRLTSTGGRREPISSEPAPSPRPWASARARPHADNRWLQRETILPVRLNDPAFAAAWSMASCAVRFEHSVRLMISPRSCVQRAWSPMFEMACATSVFSTLRRDGAGRVVRQWKRTRASSDSVREAAGAVAPHSGTESEARSWPGAVTAG